jgi:hypothetical protein
VKFVRVYVNQNPTCEANIVTLGLEGFNNRTLGGIEVNENTRDIAPNKGFENIQLGKQWTYVLKRIKIKASVTSEF